MKPKICILGATGSIGRNTLTVMKVNNFELVSASAYDNVEQMLIICQQFSPKTVVMVDETAALQLQERLPNDDIIILSGAENLSTIAQDSNVNTVMSAIVGSAGLPATLSAIRADKKVLLANKESLVMAGSIFMQELAISNAQLLPVDSEHNAIFQCLHDDFIIGEKPKNVRRILLTGSGGPFLNTPTNELNNKTPAEAIKHPNWTMGAKISVDSATMMNKGLEWIEAKLMFVIPDNDIEIIIHPESVVHSMVEYLDGSVLAQMGQSDMKIPIAYCLHYPNKIPSSADYLDFTKLKQLHFSSPDLNHFPVLSLAKQAWQAGGTSTAILNAANEIAVTAFLQKNIRFTDIHRIIEHTLACCDSSETDDLAVIIDSDLSARKVAKQYIKIL